MRSARQRHRAVEELRRQMIMYDAVQHSGYPIRPNSNGQNGNGRRVRYVFIHHKEPDKGTELVPLVPESYGRLFRNGHPEGPMFPFFVPANEGDQAYKAAKRALGQQTQEPSNPRSVRVYTPQGTNIPVEVHF